MGLVARVLETAGIPTVTLNMIWIYQAIVGMPRVAAIEHPFGRPYGEVGDADTQTAVLRAALDWRDALSNATRRIAHGEISARPTTSR